MSPQDAGFYISQPTVDRLLSHLRSIGFGDEDPVITSLRRIRLAISELGVSTLLIVTRFDRAIDVGDCGIYVPSSTDTVDRIDDFSDLLSLEADGSNCRAIKVGIVSSYFNYAQTASIRDAIHFAALPAPNSASLNAGIVALMNGGGRDRLEQLLENGTDSDFAELSGRGFDLTFVPNDIGKFETIFAFSGVGEPLAVLSVRPSRQDTEPTESLFGTAFQSGVEPFDIFSGDPDFYYAGNLVSGEAFVWDSGRSVTLKPQRFDWGGALSSVNSYADYIEKFQITASEIPQFHQ